MNRIEEAVLELKDEGDIVKTNNIFKQLNPKATSNFSDLIIIEKNELTHMKEELIRNFPIDHLRFVN